LCLWYLILFFLWDTNLFLLLFFFFLWHLILLITILYLFFWFFLWHFNFWFMNLFLFFWFFLLYFILLRIHHNNLRCWLRFGRCWWSLCIRKVEQFIQLLSCLAYFFPKSLHINFDSWFEVFGWTFHDPFENWLISNFLNLLFLLWFYWSWHIFY